MAKAGSATNSTDQRLKAEFARRKNRRASITEQYVVPFAKSRRKEKLVQTRHHEFLLQHENLVAVQEIVAHVQRLADSEALALGHVLSPMDKHRLHLWANDVLALTNQFVPSGSRETDPLLQLLEQLQALQEGHECLAEVAIEARQVVEKWERTGIFDDSRSSEEEDESEEGDAEAPDIDPRSPQQRALDWEREKRRKMEASYAYQRIRERAAAHVIKRNTLKWVRSRAAFCSRVEELEVFGNTTAGLVEELTAMSDLQRRAAVSSASNTNDIYDLVKGKKAVSGGSKIDFADLMHFSKHLALFAVDHALRRVGDIQNKRRLFQLRCLIKLQTWWRKMHEIVKGRRMLKLLEEMRRKKEQEREAELQRLHELKAKAASAKIAEANSRKAAKAAAKSSKAGAGTGNSGASSSSRSVASPKADADASTRSLTSSGTKANNRVGAQTKDTKGVMPTPPSTPKTTSISSGGGASKPKKHSVAGASKDDKMDRISRAARAREARLRKEFEEEMKRREQEDEEAAQDTEDVEAAWKRFMESAQNAQQEQASDAEDERVSTASSGASGGADSRGMTPYTTADVDEGGVEEWTEWSDDDDPAISEQDSRVTTPHSSVSSRLSTPRSNGASTHRPSTDASRTESTRRPMPPSKVVVTVKKRPPPRRPPQTPTAPESIADDETPLYGTEVPNDSGLVLPYAAAPSPSRRQLLFGTSQARHSRPALPGTGQLSKFMPFAELKIESPLVPTPPAVTVVTPRRHLHEIDFTDPHGADTNASLDMFLLAQPLFEESSVVIEDSDDHDAQAAETPSTAVNTVRVFSSVRANRMARVRAALEAKRIESASRPPTGTRSDHSKLLQSEESDLTRDDESETSFAAATPTAEPFVVFNHDVRDALLRPIRGRASMVAAYISNPMLKLDFRKEDIMRQPEAAEPSSDDIVSPEIVAPEPPTAASTKAKLGSQADWLRSMGLENAMAMVARVPNGSPPTGVRSTTKKQPQAQLATSMLTIQETTANRVRQKRKKEHALPLLGRQSPKHKKSAKKAPAIVPVEERPSPSLPPVVEPKRSVTAIPPPQQRQRRSRLRRRSTRKSSHSARGDTRDAAVSSAEESLGSSVEEGSSSDAESSYASDFNSEGGDDGTIVSGEDEEDPALASDSDVEVDDSDPGSMEPGADNSEPPGSRSRKASRRGRGSVRGTNQRKRSSLHEPRHVKERKKTRSKKKKHLKEKDLTGDPNRDPEEDGEQHSPTADDRDKKRLSGRFRPHMSSLQRRLAPKSSRVSFDMHQTQDEDDDALLGNLDDKHSAYESDVSDEGKSVDPERAAAFFKLYSQYMGLLSAAPTTLHA